MLFLFCHSENTSIFDLIDYLLPCSSVIHSLKHCLSELTKTKTKTNNYNEIADKTITKTKTKINLKLKKHWCTDRILTAQTTPRPMCTVTTCRIMEATTATVTQTLTTHYPLCSSDRRTGRLDCPRSGRVALPSRLFCRRRPGHDAEPCL